MTPINESGVRQLYCRIKSELLQVKPINQWSIVPQNWCWTTSKTKYGMADRQGVIHINQIFSGTDFWPLLEIVLRHEFAHLCIGLSAGHNQRFKHCERLFKGVFNSEAKQQAKAYGDLIKYRYRLMAELVDGELIEIKRTHRKHRKYTDYPRQRLIYSVRQQPIKRFIYEMID